MSVPTSTDIGIAAGRLKIADPVRLMIERAELDELDGRFSEDFKAGYALGLETARVMIRLSADVAAAGIQVDKIL